MKSIALILILAFASSTFTTELTEPVNFEAGIKLLKRLVPVKPEEPGKPVPTEEQPCDPESCLYCSKNGDARFCTKCQGKNIVGTGDNRRCQGETPKGCLGVESLSSSKTKCYACDEENHYHFSKMNGVNVCVKCDLSLNVLENGICLPPPSLIDGCKKHVDFHCEECQEGFGFVPAKPGFGSIPDWHKVACYPLPKNCYSIDGRGDCLMCKNGYHFENS